ncbi:VOC family protein [Actinoplanes sp. NPDC051494]|uniref:VOC family protein n=1 Tax=Actinoplanes sp. NPDC051494 TaxID=3363907 RepID=UPI003788051A
MATEGIEGVYLETHNWGKAVKFLQTLGYTVEFTSDHGSGLLRNGDGPYLLVNEVPEDHVPQTQVVLRVADAAAFPQDAGLDVVTAFEETHYGTRKLTVRDPDGRLWALEAPLKN